MGRLERLMDKKEKAEHLRKWKNGKKDKKTELPTYDLSGRPISPEKDRRRRRLIITAAAVAGAAIFIYIPGPVMEHMGSSEDTEQTVELDATAVRANTQALRDAPSEDFDGDGLINSEETTAGSDPWTADTDGDGATDYYEVKISDTDPTSINKDILTDIQTKLDDKNDKNVSSPYKIGNVILWADDYSSRSHGSVVETTEGYRFCQFSGYAQFPDDVKYAYKVENGVHGEAKLIVFFF